MASDIQLISDDEGLVLIGDPTAVEHFLDAEGIELGGLNSVRLQDVLRTGSMAAQVGSELAATSGRWLRLTEHSAELVKKHGLRQDAKTGLSTGVVKGSKSGQIGGFVQFAKSPRSMLANPSLLAGAAGLMAQVAMQQSISEMTDCLAEIDQKLDQVLRAQKDAVMADLAGVAAVIDEAWSIREHGGRVNAITWSKVQGTVETIARTQAYALRHLDALARTMEDVARVGAIAKTVEEVESTAVEWLFVLARCFQLQDAIAVLELDRVLDGTPDEVHGHRLGIKAARRKRLNTISATTERLLDRVDTANAKVLLHPTKSPAAVRSSDRVAAAVSDLHRSLGITVDRELVEARRWRDAAAEVRARTWATGVDGVGVARRVGHQTVDRAASATGVLSRRVAARSPRSTPTMGGDDDEDRGGSPRGGSEPTAR
ncbi:hypothetical protein D9V37_16390 [Nocardioides mangrovicus]|uniref:Uncharacterized protein n=2 Tax=Nocardioides mangrovicus TaxID=2478913 RepID=A0A3L8P0F8_9ACTN|nr:hypothetical protein D9V37_16390 [Nocardioides mangrovicus]